ncbi:MAG: hypothetical protein H6713_27275 [Myxococcales bacterium]|nr:hypothetical protein [Myxococcales bacterium]
MISGQARGERGVGSRARGGALTCGLWIAALVLVALARPRDASAADGARGRVTLHARPEFTPPPHESLEARAERTRARVELEELRAIALEPYPQFARGEGFDRERVEHQRALLRGLIDETPASDPEHVELRWRLADTYLDEREYLERWLGGAQRAEFTAEDRGDPDALQRVRAEIASKRRERARASETAAALLRALTRMKGFDRYPRSGEVYLYLAQELALLGRDAESEAAYVWLLRNASGVYVPSCYLGLAELAYRRGDCERARSLYKRVSEYTASPLRPRALIELGYADLQGRCGAARPARSRAAFIAALEDARPQGGPDTKPLALARLRAQRGLIEGFALDGAPADAPKFLEPFVDDHGEGLEPMLERLAGRYLVLGEHAAARVVYHELLARAPSSRARCRWAERSFAAALAEDRRAAQRQEAARLVALWARTRGAAPDSDRAQECREMIRDALTQLATAWHARALRTGAREDFATANELYTLRLALYPRSPARPELQRAHAELLWADAWALARSRTRARRASAAAQFRAAHWVLVALTRELDDARAQEVTRDRLLALENADLLADAATRQGCPRRALRCDPDIRGVAPLDVARVFPRREPTAEERARLDTYARYLAGAEDDEHRARYAPRIEYRRAALEMARNDLERARPLLMELIVKRDGTREAVWGAELLLDALMITWRSDQNTPERQLAAHDALTRWIRRLPSMELYARPEAAALRASLASARARLATARALPRG